LGLVKGQDPDHVGGDAGSGFSVSGKQPDFSACISRGFAKHMFCHCFFSGNNYM
jgi:hypothetical protein